MKKDRDYGVYLAIIAIWVMIGGLAQCESARNLDSIRQELSDIRYELKMMRYK
jgi:hypothetical protein